jgi:predicted CopG family antitoxin
MGTKTIGLDDEAYELLRSQKREDESFSDTVKRITGRVSRDWRANFGKYGDRGAELEAAASESRDRTATGVTERTSEAARILAGEDDSGTAGSGADEPRIDESGKES